MKTTFLFPGQGAQFVGMGKDIYDNYPEARAVFKEANEVLGQDIKRLCFEGPEKELGLTINTQPAILTVSTAILRVLQKAHIQADFVSGHSLGEYSALVAAEALSFADAVKTVHFRACFMQAAVKEGSGAMAAILGWSEEKIVNIFKILRIEGRVFVANLNCPGQIVIAGEKGAIEDFIAEAKKAGLKRCVILDVSVPSHCPLMKKASDLLKEYFDSIQIKAPQIPVISNVDAKIISEQKQIQPSLVRQITSVLRWEESMRFLIAKGTELFVEIGPGKVLSNLLRRIDKQAKILAIGDLDSLQTSIHLLAS